MERHSFTQVVAGLVFTVSSIIISQYQLVATVSSRPVLSEDTLAELVFINKPLTVPDPVTE